jgi:two-component system, NtrC family, response regulator HydG
MSAERSENILIVDDDKDVLYTAGLAFKRLFNKVDLIDSPSLLPKYMARNKYAVILLDMNFSRGVTSGREGLLWLEKIRQMDPEVFILATTAYGEIDLAVQSMKLGASDFITKPWNNIQLINTVLKLLNIDKERHYENDRLSRNPGEIRSSRSTYPDLISKSAIMSSVLETIKTVAPTDANVLITGENGTGKELAAWTLHCESLRKDREFVHVDLGAVPETLFESELFGHTRGAFTDAKDERAGRFESASGGTLFLDEIGNLTMPLQAKLLTVLQRREVIRLGSNKPIPIDVRLISATNMALYEMAEAFLFRQDLLYRLNTVEIVLPPLRDRKEDIIPIAYHYINIFSEKYGRQGIIINENVFQKLMDYNWPGNIRELSHSIERAVILNKSGKLNAEDFVLNNRTGSSALQEVPSVSVKDYEKKAISNALIKHKGNLSKAAQELGIARSTLYRKIAHFGLDNLC